MHTPEPWKICQHNSLLIMDESENIGISDGSMSGPFVKKPEAKTAEDNAKLIRDSPKLLRLLRDLYEISNAYDFDKSLMQEIRETLKEHTE